VKIHKGDRVEVITGKERGKTGEVTRTIPSQGRVIVAGVNIAKRHQRPVRATTQAGIIDKHMPLPVANVALICSKDGPTRAGYAFDADGRKHRVCRKCGQEL